MMRVGHRAFERLVADALDSLPDAILQMLDNVAVVVADEPTAHQVQRVRIGGRMRCCSGCTRGFRSRSGHPDTARSCRTR